MAPAIMETILNWQALIADYRELSLGEYWELIKLMITSQFIGSVCNKLDPIVDYLR